MLDDTLKNPYQYFSDQSGNALELGKIYIGEYGQNAEAYPAPVYWDAARSLVAEFPLRTIAGRIARNGTPAKIYPPQSYSITVRDKSDVIVFSGNVEGGGVLYQSYSDFIGSNEPSRGVGSIWTARTDWGDFQYKEVASGGNLGETNAAGVEFDVLPGSDGKKNARAWGLTASGGQTPIIERVFSAKGFLYFPEGIYEYAPDATTGFLSDTIISGDGDLTVFKYAPTTPPATADIQQVLRPRAYANVENVAIYDICIDGNRDGVDWSGVTAGDGNAHGIALWGSQNVFIDRVLVKNAWTDAFYLAYSHSSLDSRRQCQNIRMGTIRAENCGRQGVSIISAEDVTIEALLVDGVDRTDPKAALDLEPNNSDPDKIKNIRIGKILAKDTGAGLVSLGISTIEDVTIGEVVLENVFATNGVQIKKVKNYYIGKCTVEMADGVYYSVYATDFENLTINGINVRQKSGATITDVQGGILIDSIPSGNDFDNINFMSDSIILDGCRGNGFRHNAGTAQIGYMHLRDVNQANNSTLAAFLLAQCHINFIRADDGTGDYAIRLGSSSNTFDGGDIADGITGDVALAGNTAKWGQLQSNGSDYP